MVNQKLAVKILEKYGHSVAIAENGNQAVESYKNSVLQSKPFDVILVGVYLIVHLVYLLIGCRWTSRCRSWAA